MFSSDKAHCYKMLLIQNNQLTPEAKYLLIRILFLYGSATLVLSTEEVVKQFGLSDAVFRKARALLLQLGYLQDTKTNPEFIRTVGRPRIKLQLTQLLFDDLDKINIKLICLVHELRLDNLLFWPIGNDFLRQINKKKIKLKSQEGHSSGHTFTAATRILLAILYLHANKCGVVRNLSLAQLSKLTAMSLDRLESQLNIVNGLGYLISTISGLTNKQLFGHAKGIIFLNVFNDNLMSSCRESLLLVFNTENINDYNEMSWADRIRHWLLSKEKIFPWTSSDQSNYGEYFINSFMDKIEHKYKNFDWANNLPELLRVTQKLLETDGLFFKANYKGFQKVSELFTGGVSCDYVFLWLSLFYPFSLHEFFLHGLTNGLFAYLHAKINDYVSMILSNCWEYIDLNNVYIEPYIFKTISVDFFPWKKEDDTELDKTKKSALQLLIYCMAYQQAMLLKSLITEALASKVDGGDKCMYSILPRLIKSSWDKQIIISVHLPYQTQVDRLMVKSFYADINKAVLDKVYYVDISKVTNLHELLESKDITENLKSYMN